MALGRKSPPSEDEGEAHAPIGRSAFPEEPKRTQDPGTHFVPGAARMQDSMRKYFPQMTRTVREYHAAM